MSTMSTPSTPSTPSTLSTPSTPSTPSALGWWEAGEAMFATALDHLTADGHDGHDGRDGLGEPSLLPSWSRRTIVAHVARNADALVNLLTWARTGEETQMYPSPEARDAAIAETSRQSPAALVADCLAAARRLADAIRALPAQAWAAEVRTAQGRTVAAAEVPWMRCREVWVHAVDLDAGVTFADLPDDVLVALIDDVVATWERRGQTPGIRFSAGARHWGAGATAVETSLPELASYVTGRPDQAGGPARAGGPDRADGSARAGGPARWPPLPPWL